MEEKKISISLKPKKSLFKPKKNSDTPQPCKTCRGTGVCKNCGGKGCMICNKWYDGQCRACGGTGIG